MADAAPEVMTAPEVSAFIRVPVTTLYKWRGEGRGPRSARIGRGLRYRRTDVEKWLEQQLSASPAA